MSTYANGALNGDTSDETVGAILSFVAERLGF